MNKGVQILEDGGIGRAFELTMIVQILDDTILYWCVCVSICTVPRMLNCATFYIFYEAGCIANYELMLRRFQIPRMLYKIS